MSICDKVVEVTVEFGKGKYEEAVFEEKKDYLGTAQRTLFGPPDRVETLFGRCDQYGYLTFMHYGSSYIKGGWEGFLSQAKKNKYHYFDAGGNGYPIRIKAEELERAMRELELVLVSPMTVKELIEQLQQLNIPEAFATVGDLNGGICYVTSLNVEEYTTHKEVNILST